MIKRFFFFSVMMSAVGVPYLLSTGSEWLGGLKSRFTSSGQPAAAAPTDPQAAAGGSSFAASSFGSVPAFGTPANRLPLEGTPTYDLTELFNFNATQDWVIQRWPRVTTGISELDLQGYRVPLITGTADDDLAGSLTYYFDAERQVKLIHFRGTTGNPRKIISLMTTRYELTPQPTSDPALRLYQVKWNGKPMSELRIRTADILRASQPHSRYQVELAMKRP